MLRAELKKYWSIGISWFCHQPLHNPWLWGIPDVGGSAGKEKGGESLFLVPGKGGDRAEEESESGSSKGWGQQACEEGILVRNM